MGGALLIHLSHWGTHQIPRPAQCPVHPGQIQLASGSSGKAHRGCHPPCRTPILQRTHQSLLRTAPSSLVLVSAKLGAGECRQHTRGMNSLVKLSPHKSCRALRAGPASHPVESPPPGSQAHPEPCPPPLSTCTQEQGPPMASPGSGAPHPQMFRIGVKPPTRCRAESLPSRPRAPRLWDRIVFSKTATEAHFQSFFYSTMSILPATPKSPPRPCLISPQPRRF